MSDTTTASGTFDLNNAISSLSTAGASIFQSYEAGQVAQAAAKKLNSSGTVYVLLGLGAFALIGFALFIKK